MKIPRPKYLTLPQLALGITLGVLSGVYIYKPYFVGPNKIPTSIDKGEMLLK